MSENNRESDEVGYGRPPKTTRFKKGQSGNPGGRPRKPKGAVKVDLTGILDETVTVTQNGRKVAMHPKDVAMHRALVKGKEGDVASLIHLLDQFQKYDAVDFNEKARGGVLVLPSLEMPFEMSMILAERFGLPPWSQRQIAVGRKLYRASRTAEQAKIDDEIAYKELAS